MPNTQRLTISNSLTNAMTWRSINSNGSIKLISDTRMEEIKMQYTPVIEVCQKHKIVCSGKRAYVLHAREEHSY